MSRRPRRDLLGPGPQHGPVVRGVGLEVGRCLVVPGKA